MIYGTALVAGCMLVGYTLGTELGGILGVGNDVGGVGFAMVLLLLITNKLRQQSRLGLDMQVGIRYWGSMYIPVVVAMSASQNVASALHQGWLAILTGVGAVIVVFVSVFLLSRAGILR